MKQIIVILLFIISSAGVSAQEKEYQELIKSFFTIEQVKFENSDTSRNVLARRYLHRVINTDSVYSFFNANIFKPYRNIQIVVDDHPMPNDAIIEIFRSYRYSVLEVLSRLYSPSSLSELMPSTTLQEMVYAIIDSTTHYTEPIPNWDVTRMGERYIALTTNVRVENSLSDYAIIEDKSKRRNAGKSAEIFRELSTGVYFSGTIALKMSLPIFDEEYKYALFFFIDRKYFGRSFAIFERRDGEWTPILVTRGNSLVYSSEDFKYYGGGYYR